MTQIQIIEPLGLDKLNNSEYGGYMNIFLSGILAAGPGKLGLSGSHISQLSHHLSTLAELEKQSKASASSYALAELDNKRDQLIGYLLTQVRNALRAPFADHQAAAVTLTPVLKPYSRTASAPVIQETQQIRGLLIDLKKPVNSSAVVTLNLSQVVNELESANEDYHVLTMERTTEKASVQLTESKSLRAKINMLYAEMVTIAQAYNIVQPSAESVAFVQNINQTIAEINARHKQRMASGKKKSSASKTAGTAKKPENQQPSGTEADNGNNNNQSK